MTEDVNRAITRMRGVAALPRDNGELVFEAPWQGRALGTAVVAVERLGLAWDDFRSRLIAAIAEQPDAPYYERWLTALERLVVDSGIASTAELDERQRTERRSRQS